MENCMNVVKEMDRTGWRNLAEGDVRNLLDGERSPDWQDRSLCRQSNPETFFPEAGHSPKEAKKICGRCEVTTQCLAFALDTRQPYGVWGGKTEGERREILRRAA